MICSGSLGNIKIGSKWILVSLPLVQSYFFFVYLKVNNYTTSEGGVKYTHTYAHTNSQNRGNRNKSVIERAYIRSIFLAGGGS